MAYRTATRKPKDGYARHCPTCKKVTAWFVPAKEQGSFGNTVDIVLSPRFGKITKTGFFCQEHWEANR